MPKKPRAPTGPRDDGFIRRIELDPREVVDRTRFPLSLTAFQGFERLELHPRCTFIIGENGSGKSTLLEAIAVLAKFPAEGGSTKHQVKTHDTHSDLWQVLRLARGPDLQDDDFFLRAESFYNVGTYLHETMGTASRYGRKGSVHLTSHGESFLDVFVEWKPHGLYLLDEPESALSPSRQLAFLKRMNELINQDCQFILATHSPLIMAYPDAWIYELGPTGINRVAYEDTEHYQVTRSFLESPGLYLHHLFRE